MKTPTKTVCLLFALCATGPGLATDCTAPQTNQDMQTCADIDFKTSDKQLNIDYKAAQAYMKSLDQSLPADLKGASDALLAAQRA